VLQRRADALRIRRTGRDAETLQNAVVQNGIQPLQELPVGQQTTRLAGFGYLDTVGIKKLVGLYTHPIVSW